jgi:hypothetical protein
MASTSTSVDTGSSSSFFNFRRSSTPIIRSRCVRAFMLKSELVVSSSSYSLCSKSVHTGLNCRLVTLSFGHDHPLSVRLFKLLLESPLCCLNAVIYMCKLFDDILVVFLLCSISRLWVELM